MVVDDRQDRLLVGVADGTLTIPKAVALDDAPYNDVTMPIGAKMLTSLSLTVHIHRNGQRRRIFSNFGRSSTICTVRNRLPRCRRHPD